MKKKVIVDTDMGWDDVLSICYLMKHPQIEIAGITVTGCGETNLRWGTIIAQHLLGIGGLQAPVAAGTETPLKYHHVFPRSFREDMNGVMGLLGTLNPQRVPAVSALPAWEFLYEALQDGGEEVTVLSLGGFTNLAKLLQLCGGEARQLARLGRIVAMAGAVHVDGNVAALNDAQPDWNQGPLYATNYAAEWNVFVDPLAAQTVFRSALPLTLVPLDACNQVLLTPDYWKRITAQDPVATLVRRVLQAKSGTHAEGALPVPIFDPLATMVMAGGFERYQASEAFMDVVVEEHERDNRCGKTFVTPTGSRPIRFLQGVSAKAFGDLFAEVVNR